MKIGTFQIPAVRQKKEELLQLILRLQNNKQDESAAFSLRKPSPVIKVVTRYRTDKDNKDC